MMIIITDGHPNNYNAGYHMTWHQYSVSCKKSLVKAKAVTPNIMCIVVQDHDQYGYNPIKTLFKGKGNKQNFHPARALLSCNIFVVASVSLFALSWCGWLLRLYLISRVCFSFSFFTHRMEGGLIVDVGKTLHHKQVPCKGVAYTGDNTVAGIGGDQRRQARHWRWRLSQGSSTELRGRSW